MSKTNTNQVVIEGIKCPTVDTKWIEDDDATWFYVYAYIIYKLYYV